MFLPFTLSVHFHPLITNWQEFITKLQGSLILAINIER